MGKKKILISLTEEEAERFKALACIFARGNTSELIRQCVKDREESMSEINKGIFEEILDSDRKY